MDATEKYLFEVHGYLVIEGALSPEEVAAANAAIDHHADQIGIRPNDLAHESETLKGTQGRGDLGGMLTWDKPHCDPFRAMIAHARFKPYLEELLGPGFRLEGLGIITMDEGAEGFWFHEGGEPLGPLAGFPLPQWPDVLRDDQHRRAVGGCGAGGWGIRLLARQP